MKNHTPPLLRIATFILALLIILGGLSYLTYLHFKIETELAETKSILSTTTDEYEQRKIELYNEQVAAENENEALKEAIRANEKKLSIYEEQINEFADTVGTFEKLKTLDPELLQKYSKVYFLNEHYIPSSLTTIPPEYISGAGRVLKIHSSVWQKLQQMIDAANTDNLHLLISSAYRSFAEQKSLKSTYAVTYGTGANKFSADQGYSEHQLGTTVDLTTASTCSLTKKFETTPEFKWMQAHAYKYGFALSYPKNNSYYVYEPWHWRYVGLDLAEKLHEENKYLYDLDQRDIDGYLISIFD